MRTLVILPPVDLHQADSERAISVAERQFASLGPVGVAAPRDWLGHYRAQLPGRALEPFDAEAAPAQHDTFVFVEAYRGETTPPGPHGLTLPRPATQRIYWFVNGARLKLVQPPTYDEFELPHVNAHVFQRLSARTHGFVSFPYGPLYSDVEVGPVNEFGFRVPQDYRKHAVRPPDKKLAVVFGGSAAFSYYCRPEETFAAQLEATVNQALSDRGSESRFTVLNFGMHDNVVMQEMLTYMLFVHELKPDFVLAHDGHNDIYYGLQADPHLLNEFDIIYQRYAEEWSKILHATAAVATPPLYSIAVDGQQLNFPQNIIRVYMKRKRQFGEMVAAQGGTFIWGVQPIHSSKGRLSARELLKCSQAERGVPMTPEFRKFVRCLSYAYGLLSTELARQSDLHVVDFNRRFQAYDERWELMWDKCHASPAGDAIIAEHYRDTILALL